MGPHMMRFRSGLPVMAAIIALGAAGLAFAHEHDGENSQRMAAALAAETTLTQAVTSPEQQSGDCVFRIKFENHDGTYEYAVNVITKDDKLSEISLDPTTGKTLRIETEGLISRVFDGEDREAVAELTGAQTTLTGAIAVAER